MFGNEGLLRFAIGFEWIVYIASVHFFLFILAGFAVIYFLIVGQIIARHESLHPTTQISLSGNRLKKRFFFFKYLDAYTSVMSFCSCVEYRLLYWSQRYLFAAKLPTVRYCFRKSNKSFRVFDEFFPSYRSWTIHDIGPLRRKAFFESIKKCPRPV